MKQYYADMASVEINVLICRTNDIEKVTEKENHGADSFRGCLSFDGEKTGITNRQIRLLCTANNLRLVIAPHLHVAANLVADPLHVDLERLGSRHPNSFPNYPAYFETVDRSSVQKQKKQVI